MRGVAELFEMSDQSMLGGGAIALIEVRRAEVDVGAIVLEKVPDDNQNGVANGNSGLVAAAVSEQPVVLRC